MKTFIFGLVVLSAGSAFAQPASPKPDTGVPSMPSKQLVLPANSKAPATTLMKDGALVESEGQRSVVSNNVFRANEVVPDVRAAGEAPSDATPARASRITIPANTLAPAPAQSGAEPVHVRPAQD